MESEDQADEDLARITVVSATVGQIPEEYGPVETKFVISYDVEPVAFPDEEDIHR